MVLPSGVPLESTSCRIGSGQLIEQSHIGSTCVVRGSQLHLSGAGSLSTIAAEVGSRTGEASPTTLGGSRASTGVQTSIRNVVHRELEIIRDDLHLRCGPDLRPATSVGSRWPPRAHLPWASRFGCRRSCGTSPG